MSFQAPTDEKSKTPEALYIRSRSDFRDGLGWISLGVAIFIGSVLMDRLKQQDINPYTIPGLLPGLLGIGITILGTLLILRSRARMQLHAAAADRIAAPSESFLMRHKQLIFVLLLCATFDLVLVGHGLPFWLASAIFVTISILTFEQPKRQATGRRLLLRDVMSAVAIGLGAGVGITLVFQEIFLVRLP